MSVSLETRCPFLDQNIELCFINSNEYENKGVIKLNGF